MKKFAFNVAAVLAFALLSAPAALGDGAVQRRARLDFDFVFGGRRLPAGTYVIKRLNGSTTADRFLVIEDAKGRRRAVTLAMSINPTQGSRMEDLVFRKANGEYYLAGVQLGDPKYAIDVPKDRARSQADGSSPSTRQ
jgi:hypothetical protein